MKEKTTLVWLRRDLRLADHPALVFAAARGKIVPVYIFDPDETPRPGAASRWALHQIMRDLAARLNKLGAPLILRRGRPSVVLKKLIKETNADCLVMTRQYEPSARARDATMEKDLGIQVKIFGASLLFEPEEVQTKNGKPFRIFTPFCKACLGLPPPDRPLSAPRNLRGVRGLESDALDSWNLTPRGPDWSRGWTKFWKLSEKAAQERLRFFIAEKLVFYARDRDRPDRDGTSLLSVALHFGLLSPRQIFHDVQRAVALRPALARGGEAYIRELCWRDFSAHLLFHFPELPSEPLQKSFAHFPWRKDEAALRAWQKGETGYPIVDAGMRQLWQTGTMHNRARMIVASFLVKDLLLPWQVGAAWFWDTLCDADLASNVANWQWVAGCGTDAAPYFRIFNPVLQGRKFDPEGVYVKRYLPEIKGINGKAVHAPRQKPKPLVDHAVARIRALEALKKSKKT